MAIFSSTFRAFGFILAIEFLAGQTPEVMSVELQPRTVEAFNRYVQATQTRADQQLARPGQFLYIDGLPQPRRAQALAELKRGEIYMERPKTLDASGREIEAPNGLIHHWLGVAFVPRASVREAIALVEDYDHHQDIYKPEVLRSRLVSRNGNDFKIFYRLRKHKVITVTLNTDHNVHYTQVDATRWISRSTATRIAEVADADTTKEHEKPVGNDGGFLWRMESWWRFEERDGGVYIESESVSLTRDIPLGLKWLIGPFVTGIPKESLQMTMGSTRTALLARIAAAQKR